MERLGLELEKTLDRETCYVADVDSGKTMDPLMTFGGDNKQYFGTGPNVLGWGMAAGFGVKLARPDVPVVSVVGDGSFLFSGPQPLWSMARYKAPVTVIVLNNHSYNNERNRIWNGAGRQFDAARDMTCYNGSPDVDFAKAADAFGVDGETVKEPVDTVGRVVTRQGRDGGGTAVSARHPHQARRNWCGLGMVSALLHRRAADAEGVKHAYCFIRSGRACSGDDACGLRVAKPRPAECQPAAAGRRSRDRRGGVLAMPLSRYDREDPRWRRRLAYLRQQYGAARRAVDTGRGR